MENPEKETVADALNEAFGYDTENAKYADRLQMEINKLNGHEPRGIISDLKVVQAWHNRMTRESCSPTPNFWLSERPAVSIWRRLWWKIRYPFEFRLVHKDRIDQEEF